MARKILLFCFFLSAVRCATADDSIVIRRFSGTPSIGSAGRPLTLTALLMNRGKMTKCDAKLSVPAEVSARPLHQSFTQLNEGQIIKLSWQLTAEKAVSGDAVLQLRDGNKMLASATMPVRFLAPVKQFKHAYIPPPHAVKTSMLVGAINCPLWEADKFSLWDQVLYKHPERVPALGFYAQENPEIADWETKWALEHGISFFTYCWYRDGQGGAIKTRFGSAIHDALFKSKFADKFKFTIMWENQSRGTAGVADENDLMNNLLPYWMENYFKNPNYLKIDNKPLLFIYRPEFLVQDLSGVENVKNAFEKMRAACRVAGFDGLYILGEYRGLDPKHFALMQQLGLDYTFAYVWPLNGSPAPEKAVSMQMDLMRQTQKISPIPQVLTVSQAWSGWRDEGSMWKLPPNAWEKLLRGAKDFAATLPKNQLGSQMLLLDNWNEWSEGHYIAPYREYGFGYLDAVRRVFADAPENHTDLLPEDIGFGPYDTAFQTHLQQEDEIWQQTQKYVLKGQPEAGLVAWWSFDEDLKSPFAYDYSGHRLGGAINSSRAAGLDGNALVCDGGSVQVASDEKLDFKNGLTIECWVKTDVAGQDNKWILNKVHGGAEDSGYRMGILGGKPCFEVPQSAWSHHLQADIALPTDRWTHLAGTFDGQTMKIYVDGVEHGLMPRPGPVKSNSMPLSLGNYEEKHPAYFRGLLDEVKLFDQALSATEIKAHAQIFQR